MTKGGLFQYVREFYDQDENTLTDETLATLTQAVEGALNRGLQKHPRMRARLSWLVEGGKNLVPLSEDIIDIKSLKVGRVSYRQYPSALEEKASVCTPSFINRGNCLEMFPVPTQSTTVTLDVTVALPSLVSGTVPYENWVSKMHADVYQAGLLSHVAGFIKDSASQQLWAQRFKELVNQLKLQGWNEAFSDGPRVASA